MGLPKGEVTVTTKMKLLVGLTAISAGIREFKGIIANADERAQNIAVSIINHDLNGGKDGEPSGDCSKSKDLVNALRTQEDKRNMIAWLAFFGNIGCKMESGVCTEVKHIAADSKRYRKPDLEAAQVHNWYEPYLPNGEKAHWFSGPDKPVYTPGTLADLGQNVVNFGDRFLGTERRTGDLFATKDNGAGKSVPIYDLNNTEIEQARTLFEGVRKFGLMLMARERAEEYTAEVVKLNSFIDSTSKVLGDVAKLGETETEEAEETEAAVA
jgi:hypothetical protein